MRGCGIGIGIGLLALLLAGCGNGGGKDDGGTDGGADGGVDCPDLAGAWSLEYHCGMGAGGASGTIAQDGCELSLTYGDGDQASGTVDQDGRVELQIELDDGQTTCSGTLDGDSLGTTCSPGTCTLDLSRS